MKPKDCTCTGVCLQIPDGSCQRLNKSMYSGSDKVPQFISLEPKADPKEKELYSIKDLEWKRSPNASDKIAESIFGDYKVYQSSDYPGKWRIWHQRNTLHGPFETIELAMQSSQDHFNSKLKLCLNREL